MNSDYKKTATYRKFIRTPRYISAGLGAALWLAIITHMKEGLVWQSYLGLGLLALAVCGITADQLASYMSKWRFNDWVIETQGISDQEEIDDFINDVDPEELEEMVQTSESMNLTKDEG